MKASLLASVVVYVSVLSGQTPVSAGHFDDMLDRVRSKCSKLKCKHDFHDRNACECDYERAGQPRKIAWWAKCSPTRKYKGYYVGGGAPLYAEQANCIKGERRYFDEGTFGLDYDPWYSRVRLQWYHRHCR